MYFFVFHSMYYFFISNFVWPFYFQQSLITQLFKSIYSLSHCPAFTRCADWQVCTCGVVNTARSFAKHRRSSVDIWSLYLCPRSTICRNWSVILRDSWSSCSTPVAVVQLYWRRFVMESGDSSVFVDELWTACIQNSITSLILICISQKSLFMVHKLHRIKRCL